MQIRLGVEQAYPLFLGAIEFLEAGDDLVTPQSERLGAIRSQHDPAGMFPFGRHGT